MELTEEQLAAVNAGPMVCLTACAGSGKTTVLVERILKLIKDGAEPDKIVAITFTRRAAKELQNRLSKKGVTIGYSGTVHSFCLGLINKHRTNKLAACPYELFLERINKTASESFKHVNIPSAETILKHEGESDWFATDNIIRFVRNRLGADGLIDFEGILKMVGEKKFVVEKLDRLHDYHLLIDEFQDTGPLERKFYELLNPRTMMIVGDSRQTLYTFRGADPESMNSMASMKGMEQLRLNKNFRCTGEIDNLANMAFKGFMHSEIPFRLEVIAEIIAQKKPNTVLCGRNQTVDDLSNALSDHEVKVDKVGRPTFFQQGMEAYIRYRMDPDNSSLLSNVVGMVSKDELVIMQKQATASLCDLSDVVPAEGPHCLRYLESEFQMLKENNPGSSYAELAELILEPPKEVYGMLVTTIHSAKGLEWDSVVVVDDMGINQHHNRMRYVAYTRARRELNIYKLLGANNRRDS